MDNFDKRLSESAERRAEVISRFGFVPTSVIRELGRGGINRSVFHYAAERNMRPAGVQSVARTEMATTEEGKAAARARRERGLLGGVKELTGTQRENLSVMPGTLVEFVIRMYEPKVYVDPFSAQGVQAQVAALMGIDYYGQDLTDDYVAFTNNVLKHFELDDDQHVEVRRGDSRSAEWVPDGIGDLLFTSPPYFDIEHYSDDDEQLGKADSYEDFMQLMTDVYKAWLPKLKSDAFCVINTNDFKRDGELLTYHADTITALRSAGYRIVDIAIIDGLVGGLQRAFAVQAIRQKRFPKLHEYLIVARAP